MSSTTSQQTIDVARVRQDFPIFSRPLPNGADLVFLDNASSAQKPQQVIQKEVDCYERYYANAHRGIYQFGVAIDEELEGSRAKVQRFISAAEPEEIIFTSGTTMSINLVAYGWGRKFVKPDDEILINEMEHHANLVPWQQLAKETGAKLNFIPLTDDYRLDLSQLDDVLTKRTKIVALTSMSNVVGTINDVSHVAARAKSAGAITVVDAAQSAARSATNVQSTGVDFLAFSGHKIYGPTGVGVLYGRRERLEEMDPFLTGGGMIDRVFRDHSTWAELPAKFEAGTPQIAQAIALGAAIDYVSSCGMNAIQTHEVQLLKHATASLAEVLGLKIYGPDQSHKGAIVSFTVDGAHPQDIASLVDRKGVAVRQGHHCTMPLHDLMGVSSTVRASFGMYNSEADVDVLVDALHYARKRLRLT